MRNGHEAFLGDDMAIYVNGLLMTYVTDFSCRVEYEMKDVPLVGKQFMQYRKGMGRITGTMSGFTHSHYLLNIANSQTQRVSIVGTMTNPSTKKTMKVELSDVQFTAADLMNLQVNGDPAKFELPYVAGNMKELASF